MKIWIPSRTWKYVEASLFGLLIAVVPAANFSQLDGGWLWPFLGLLLSLGWIALAWTLVRRSTSIGVAFVQFSLALGVILTAGLLLLAGFSTSELIPRLLAGVALGLLYTLVGSPAWLGGILAVASALSPWLFWFSLSFPRPELHAAMWAGGLAMASPFLASLLARHLSISRSTRLFTYTTLAALACGAPLLNLLDGLPGNWHVPTSGWWVGIGGTALIGLLAGIFEMNAFPSLWAMPALLANQMQAGLTMLQYRPAAALAHYDQALWVRSQQSKALRLKGFALYLLGEREEALRISGWFIEEWLKDYQECPSWQESKVLALLSELDKAVELFHLATARHRLLDALDSPDTEYRQLVMSVVTQASVDSLRLLIEGLEHDKLIVRRFVLGQFFANGLISELFKLPSVRSRLLDALDSPDSEYRQLAISVMTQAPDDSLQLIINGLDHNIRNVRRYVLKRVLASGLTGEIIRHIGEQLPHLPLAIALACVQALVECTPEDWSRLIEEAASYQEPNALDVLAEAMLHSDLSQSASLVWDGLRQALLRRLLDGLWVEDLALARQAALLALKMGPAFTVPYIRAFFALDGKETEDKMWAARRHAAQQLARLAFLGLETPGVVARPSLPASRKRLSLLLSGPFAGSGVLPIPVVKQPGARATLLLVSGESYHLQMESTELKTTELAKRMHVIVDTDNIPVDPSHHQVLEPHVGASRLDFLLRPEEVTLDRLTVKLIADGHNLGWLMDFSAFVVDAVVLKGLKT